MEIEKPDTEPIRETAQADEQGSKSQADKAAPLPVVESAHSEAEERDAEEERDKTDQHQDEAIDSLAENAKLIAQQTEWAKKQADWTRNQFWAALALGLLTLIVLAYQASTMSGQLDAYKQAVYLENSAIVNMASASIDTPIVQAVPGKEIKVSLELLNTGRTPAKNVIIKSNFSLLYKELPPDFNYPVFRTERIQAVIPASRPFTYRAGFKMPSEDYKNQVIGKGLKLYFWGVIEYDDVFQCRHQTEFCAYSDSYDAAELSFCETHNDTKPVGKCDYKTYY